MSIIESLKWRSAIKQFDPEKKVSAEDLTALLEAADLAPTSGGFQTFKVIAISNDQLKSELLQASYGQKQVVDCSHILVFAYETNIGEQTVLDYIKLAAETRNHPESELDGYRDSMFGFINSMDQTARNTWGRSQTYIALGMVMAAAAALKIDSCPMEGLDPVAYQKLLGLEDKNLMPVAILPIGYRSEEDYYSKLPKVRKGRENLVIEFN
ncbi:MAG: NAD(P)H-dependent oxidoreductase [Flavobacteriales bacterium]|nr:NAD(P)H-dependent oxidoreductase [Flavobacteriales bacterium]